MLYDKEEMLRICEKYGIETVEKEGAPLYMGKEMDDNFSFEQMMREPCLTVDENIVLSSEIVSFTVPVYYNTNKQYNVYKAEETKKLNYASEENNYSVESTIPCDSENKFAA